jgi:hypothetical protein
LWRGKTQKGPNVREGYSAVTVTISQSSRLREQQGAKRRLQTPDFPNIVLYSDMSWAAKDPSFPEKEVYSMALTISGLLKLGSLLNDASSYLLRH